MTPWRGALPAQLPAPGGRLPNYVFPRRATQNLAPNFQSPSKGILLKPPFEFSVLLTNCRPAMPFGNRKKIKGIFSVQ